MADFMTAVKWMKEGKTVRRQIWDNESTHYLLDSLGRVKVGKSGSDEYHYATMFKENLLANDWEIYEELKPTLWDKRKPFMDAAYFHEEDAIEALHEFLNFLTKDSILKGDDNKYVQKAKEIFGEEFFNE